MSQERREWRVIKVEFVEAKLTLREALKKKRELNAKRDPQEEPRWKVHYRAERMDDL